MEPEIMSEIVKNAHAVSNRYKRACWHASLDDLVQEAMCAQLEALPKFEPDRGRPVGAYLFYVALFAARRLLLKMSAPVSASHDLRDLKHLQRAPVDEMTVIDDNPERAQSACQIHDRVVECLGGEGAEFAYAMFVEGWKPAEVAKANGKQPREVYWVMRDVRERLRSDELLHEMWEECR